MEEEKDELIYEIKMIKSIEDLKDIMDFCNKHMLELYKKKCFDCDLYSNSD